jgi:hypothetical protein
MSSDPRFQNQHALRQAHRASKRGDLAAAERWLKVAAQSAAELERFLSQPREPVGYEDEEDVREELRRRLERFVAFDQDVQRWEEERDLYIEMAKIAARTGANPPPPLRRRPGGSPETAEQYMIHLLQGPEPNDGR